MIKSPMEFTASAESILGDYLYVNLQWHGGALNDTITRKIVGVYNMMLDGNFHETYISTYCISNTFTLFIHIIYSIYKVHKSNPKLDISSHSQIFMM